jgi:hypothetical protein
MAKRFSWCAPKHACVCQQTLGLPLMPWPSDSGAVYHGTYRIANDTLGLPLMSWPSDSGAVYHGTYRIANDTLGLP